MDKELKNIRARLEKLEKIVFVSVKPRKHILTNDAPQTLAGYILKLRDQNFFKSAKTPKEVHQKLQPMYECEPKRVSVELIRLHKKKVFRKKSKAVDGKNLTAYVN